MWFKKELQEEFSNAVPLFKKAVEIYKLNLGETHPIVISAIDNFNVAKSKFSN